MAGGLPGPVAKTAPESQTTILPYLHFPTCQASNVPSSIARVVHISGCLISRHGSNLRVDLHRNFHSSGASAYDLASFRGSAPGVIRNHW